MRDLSTRYGFFVGDGRISATRIERYFLPSIATGISVFLRVFTPLEVSRRPSQPERMGEDFHGPPVDIDDPVLGHPDPGIGRGLLDPVLVLARVAHLHQEDDVPGPGMPVLVPAVRPSRHGDVRLGPPEGPGLDRLLLAHDPSPRGQDRAEPVGHDGHGEIVRRVLRHLEKLPVQELDVPVLEHSGVDDPPELIDRQLDLAGRSSDLGAHHPFLARGAGIFSPDSNQPRTRKERGHRGGSPSRHLISPRA